jgi:peptide-methionine (S)-S-oxide reductase
MTPSASSEVATLAGGCFWCIEAVYQEIDGVESVVPGYTGGSSTNPTYEQVSTGKSGHAEAVQVTFDPAEVSYREILEIFFSAHDPTTLNRQGADVGTQYRSAIFYHSDKQKTISQEVMKEINKARLWERPMVTQVAPISKFYPAEDYHRDYFKKHPEHAYCQAVISPNVNKLRTQWVKRLKR